MKELLKELIELSRFPRKPASAMKINWTPEELAELCRRECFTCVFWKSLGIALVWSLSNSGIMYASFRMIRGYRSTETNLSLLLLPVPVLLMVGLFAGWLHGSTRIRQMIFVMSGLVYLATLPLMLLLLLIARGISSVA